MITAGSSSNQSNILAAYALTKGISSSGQRRSATSAMDTLRQEVQVKKNLKLVQLRRDDASEVDMVKSSRISQPEKSSNTSLVQTKKTATNLQQTAATNKIDLYV